MHLAHLNIARAQYALDAPEMKTFVDQLASISTIAQKSDGFIWQLVGTANNVMKYQSRGGDNIIVNLSVWSSLERLINFMSNTQYSEFIRRKSEWFESSPGASYVLWWQEEEVIPTVDEAMIRLEHLRSYSDSPYAFSLKVPFAIDKA